MEETLQDFHSKSVEFLKQEFNLDHDTAYATVELISSGAFKVGYDKGYIDGIQAAVNDFL